MEQGKANGNSSVFRTEDESSPDSGDSPVERNAQDPLFGNGRSKTRSGSTTRRTRRTQKCDVDLTERETLHVKYLMNGEPTIGTFKASFVCPSVPVSGSVPFFQIVLNPVDPNLPARIPQMAVMNLSMMSHLRPVLPPREMSICEPIPAAVIHPPVIHHRTPSPLITRPPANPTVPDVPAKAAVAQGASRKPDSDDKVWTGMSEGIRFEGEWYLGV